MNTLLRHPAEHAPITDLAQLENSGFVSGEKIAVPGMSEACRAIGADSAVLLKNADALPLRKDAPVAYFGRCQRDYFYVGYGSGGDLNPLYRISPMDALRELGAAVDEEVASAYEAWCAAPENAISHGTWGNWPRFYPEMPLPAGLAEEAAKRCETAVVILGRAAGEDRENTLTPGSFYLTEEERALLDEVTAAFTKVVVVLNIGNIIDFSWCEAYGERISALLISWQCGMESGHALTDVLYGAVSPSGRLPDTIARTYENYPSSTCFGNPDCNEYEEDLYVGYRWFDTFAPEAALYRFGDGLSYTSFSVSAGKVSSAAGSASPASSPDAASGKDAGYCVPVTVTNTGSCSGRRTVLLWCTPPEGRLDRPAKTLAAFGKTPLLLPGQHAELLLRFTGMDIASFDDVAEAWVLEPGSYIFDADGCDAGTLDIASLVTLEAVEPACDGDVDLRSRILARLPETIPQTGDRGIRLQAVAAGNATLEDFIAQLSDTELEAISRGEGPMDSPFGPEGNAGAFGGVSDSLRAKGIPPVITSDGPAGLRLKQYTSLLPCGTALAASFDTALTEHLYRLVGQEMHLRGVDVILGPGMNIHRNPLCGRNFEYYSEDPLLTGKIAAACVRGVQSQGVSACVKHFACNNQETNRNRNDSVVTERALREIYLRGFEIAIRESSPNVLMTSYNKINGVWSHYNYDLAVTVLRREWNYQGLVITDWWMQYASSPEFPQLKDNAYRVRAGVDVLMPGSRNFTDTELLPDAALLASLKEKDGLTRGELQLVARHVLEMILRNIPVERYPE